MGNIFFVLRSPAASTQSAVLLTSLFLRRLEATELSIQYKAVMQNLISVKEAGIWKGCPRKPYSGLGSWPRWILGPRTMLQHLCTTCCSILSTSDTTPNCFKTTCSLHHKRIISPWTIYQKLALQLCGFSCFWRHLLHSITMKSTKYDSLRAPWNSTLLYRTCGQN